jgi:hypothetical protein
MFKLAYIFASLDHSVAKHSQVTLWVKVSLLQNGQALSAYLSKRVLRMKKNAGSKHRWLPLLTTIPHGRKLSFTIQLNPDWMRTYTDNTQTVPVKKGTKRL